MRSCQMRLVSRRRTECSATVCSHVGTKRCEDAATFEHLTERPHGIAKHTECRLSDLVAAELGEQLLLSRQIQIFVLGNLVLVSGNAPICPQGSAAGHQQECVYGTVSGTRIHLPGG